MNTPLWLTIQKYDLDLPVSEYGFSTRLAHENYWSRHFTQRAIMEYKKFMYLAATSDMMVSPSAVVDTVWHQHLIFTQSYRDFCNVLGKEIQHVPSTHNREDFAKFMSAKERTNNLYAKVFGEQPKDIWDYEDMYASLNLKKAKFKIRSFLLLGIAAFIALLVPAYFILLPVYRQIDNPDFAFIMIALAGISFITLNRWNKSQLNAMLSHVDRSSFIFDLHPFEVLYMRTQSLTNVINGVVNDLILKKKMVVVSNTQVDIVSSANAENIDEHVVMNITGRLQRPVRYEVLASALRDQFVFKNTQTFVEAFGKYVRKSKKFGDLFYLNFGVLGFIFLLAATRLVTGIVRDKPTGILATLLMVFLGAIVIFLFRLSNQMTSSTIPKAYEALKLKDEKEDWMWAYTFRGAPVLVPLFIPLASDVTGGQIDSSSSSGSSSDSSCGSSCSSCGGCGGGD
jgi:hypothetical protein